MTNSTSAAHSADGTPPRAAPASGSKQFSADTSLNYSVAKVVSIFMVLLGHWFTGTILWVPVTFGLVIFAFSSAYFTGKIYGIDIDKQRFWRKKIERLGLRFWVILLFLAIVLAFMGRTVLHWHSLVHVFGLSGFLNWFAIPNKSALGGGLWFFTLLLIFYGTYPYMAALSRTAAGAAVLAAVSTVAALVLHQYVVVGHALWLTALGFVLGVSYSLHEIKIGANKALAVILGSCAMIGVIHVLGIKQLTGTLIVLTSVAICVWLACVKSVFKPFMQKIATLEKYLLEIFLIHTYLFVHPTGISVLDLSLSIGLIMVAAVALHWVSNRLSDKVYGK